MTKGDGGGAGLGGGSSCIDLSGGFWPGTAGGSVGGVWATGLVVSFLLFFHLLRALLARRSLTPKSQQKQKPSSSSSSVSAPIRVPDVVVSDADLSDLIDDLQGKLPPTAMAWEDVIDKSNDLLSYNAKCCRQKDGSLKYLSTTTFEKCSTEFLRDFYMDNNYRKKWDKTVVDHEQLDLDEINMIEVGRTIKKFPFLTPREYILAWRIWEGKDKTFYCLIKVYKAHPLNIHNLTEDVVLGRNIWRERIHVANPHIEIKDCEHPLAPLQKKYVRVGFFRSGWRIRKVPAQDACKITVVHQEDAGLNVEMAKLAFAKGIWSYVCKMNSALREYSSWIQMMSKPVTPLRCIQVPADLESKKESSPVNLLAPSEDSNLGWQERSTGSPSKKWITKGFLLLGGVVCLSRGHSSLATQLAMAFFLKKLTRHGQEQEPEESQEPNQKDSPRPMSRGGRWALRQQSWSEKSNNTGLLSRRHDWAINH